MSVVILCLKIFIFASTLLLMLLGAFFSISAAVMDVRANVGIYLFKVNNRNTRVGCEIYSVNNKDTRTTPGVAPESLLLTFNIFLALF